MILFFELYNQTIIYIYIYLIDFVGLVIANQSQFLKSILEKNHVMKEFSSKLSDLLYYILLLLFWIYLIQIQSQISLGISSMSCSHSSLESPASPRHEQAWDATPVSDMCYLLPWHCSKRLQMSVRVGQLGWILSALMSAWCSRIFAKCWTKKRWKQWLWLSHKFQVCNHSED